jgi:glycosyltransferase involved in cell wall biosynthesis
MRIFNMIQCANLGGMEHSCLALLIELKARGHQVELLSLNTLGGLGPLLAAQAIPADGLPYRGRGGWRSLPQLKRRLAGVRSDALIMTGHNLLGMLALGDLCQKRRLLSIHFHHAGVKPTWQWRLIYRAARSRFSAIAFPTDFIRREAEAIYPPIGRMSHTIGSPISLLEMPRDGERAAARRALGVPERAYVVGNAGWLIPRKRFDVFLQVARNIASEEPDALFVIAGEGPEGAALRSLARQLGIADRVLWLGWQCDLTSFYRSLDLLLFNADWEALGRTPLEALAAGVPVVASVLNGGLSEVLDAATYPMLFARHDIAQLTHAALGVLREPSLSASVIASGRERLEQVASAAGYADRVCRLLEPNSDSRGYEGVRE